MKLNVISLLVVISILLSGCKKYEEGPGISFRSKTERAINIWTFAKVTDASGTDITANYEDWFISLDENNNVLYRWEVVGSNIDTYGTWAFSDKKTVLALEFNNSLLEAALPKMLNILKLKNKDMKLSADNGYVFEMSGAL